MQRGRAADYARVVPPDERGTTGAPGVALGTLFAIASVALAGCGEPARDGVDASIEFEIPDGGPAPDAGGDGGAEGDAGDGTCGMIFAINGWGELPASCLPRCSAATRAAVEACADDDACVAAAWGADATPEVVVATYAGPLRVSCGGGAPVYGCAVWQTFSCQADTCPPEYAAWTECVAGGGDCAAETDALASCNAGSTDFAPCLEERIAACYAR